MANVLIVTDSGCDLPDEITQRLDVVVVPLTIRFGTQEYVDRVDITTDEFWDKCAASPTLPETAAPSPGAFQGVFEQAADRGYDAVVCLTLSAQLSGTHQSATIAASAVAGRIPVTVVDTQAATAAEGLLVMEAAERAQRGDSADEIVAAVTERVPRTGIIGALDTLEHLIKGGRVGGAKALFGQVLSIKPLVKLEEGLVTEAGRQRTRSKALAAVAAEGLSHAPFERLAIMSARCSDVDQLVALVADAHSTHPVIAATIGPVVGTHAGPGTIGLAWIEAPR